jgi:hypothetical protein
MFTLSPGGRGEGEGDYFNFFTPSPSEGGGEGGGDVSNIFSATFRSILNHAGIGDKIPPSLPLQREEFPSLEKRG